MDTHNNSFQDSGTHDARTQSNKKALYTAMVLLGADEGLGDLLLIEVVERIFHQYSFNRVYHDLDHLNEGIDFVISSHYLMGMPKVFIAQLIAYYAWHDLFYRPGFSGNERASSQLWAEHALGLGVEIQHVKLGTNVIQDTDHKKPTLAGVSAFVSDLDLMRLGSSPEMFDEYSRQVFKEYGVKSEDIPAAMMTRAKSLQKFLDRPSIYFTEIGASLEDKARANLRRIGCVDPRSNQISITPH